MPSPSREFMMSFAGLFPEWDDMMMGQSRQEMMRAGVQQDRGVTDAGSTPIEEVLAGRREQQIRADLADLDMEQNRFDREFYKDPKTGELLARRSPTEEVDGQRFTLLGRGGEGDEFHLDKADRSTVLGRVDDDFDFVRDRADVSPTQARPDDKDGLAVAPFRSPFAKPGQNFLGKVGPQADPPTSDLQQQLLKRLTGEFKAEAGGIQRKADDLAFMRKAVLSGGSLADARKEFAKRDQAEAKAHKDEGFKIVTQVQQAAKSKAALLKEKQKMTEFQDPKLPPVDTSSIDEQMKFLDQVITMGSRRLSERGDFQEIKKDTLDPQVENEPNVEAAAALRDEARDFTLDDAQREKLLEQAMKLELAGPKKALRDAGRAGADKDRSARLGAAAGIVKGNARRVEAIAKRLTPEQVKDLFRVSGTIANPKSMRDQLHTDSGMPGTPGEFAVMEYLRDTYPEVFRLALELTPGGAGEGDPMNQAEVMRDQSGTDILQALLYAINKAAKGR